MNQVTDLALIRTSAFRIICKDCNHRNNLNVVPKYYNLILFKLISPFLDALHGDRKNEELLRNEYSPVIIYHFWNFINVIFSCSEIQANIIF
jgi:hypothetical protein